jgi:hypothetical protein
MASKKKSLHDLSGAQLVAINNAIAKRYEDVKKVSRFLSKDAGVEAVRSLLGATGEQVIFVLQPDYVKRGASANRSFTFYKDGMISSEYVELCVEAGFTATIAKRDLRYDNNKGLICLV